MLVVVIDPAHANGKGSATALSVALDALACRYMVAGDGESGLELCRLHLPQLVFCSVELPDMSGYRLAKALHEEKGLASAGVWMLTDTPDEIAQAWAMRQGGQGVVARDVAAMEQIVRNALKAISGADGAAAAIQSAGSKPEGELSWIDDVFVRFSGPMGVIIAEEVRTSRRGQWDQGQYIAALSEHLDDGPMKREFLESFKQR